MADIGTAAADLAKAAEEYAKAKAEENEALRRAREAYDAIYKQAESWDAETATAATRAYHDGPEKKLLEAERKRKGAEEKLQRALIHFQEELNKLIFGR